MDTRGLMKALAGGLVAGAIGTVAMDLVWFRRSRAAGSDASFGEFEFSGDTTSFDDAGGPAAVGQMAAEAVGTEIPEKYAGLTTDVVHWLTGSGWGIGGSVLAALTGIPAFAAGLVSGAAAFAGAYTILPGLGIYDPIWEYEGKTLWKDATAHATYGAATGAALLALGAMPLATKRLR